MSTVRFTAALVVVLGLFVGGCGTQKNSVEMDSTLVSPATDVTLDEYLKNQGVRVEPQTQETLKVVKIGVQQPVGWLVNMNFQIPNTYLVITDTGAIDDGFAPNAVVIIHKLVGKLDAREVIRRGYVDTQRFKNFKQKSASMADYKDRPSAVIEGTFENESGQSLQVLNRYVMVSVEEQNFVVLLSVTTTAAQAGALENDVRTLDGGLNITT
ncbi:putative lipoprotein LpqT precursor [Mycobacteroides stephanolepidis]|uniref:Putative lipoprotein LpqT n=1 Tax=[Mycobacterium] stephanolepidis TaxID=1520670 RepID=A0A1Z4ES57_9MYCO|nr:LpqN/LpqT family lipoprotein [[Mycobacterium] stephanolepidis]BAX95796.1 putative lipoprotein LpqT precursor [[Mycobacterium] stephanolepidis]